MKKTIAILLVLVIGMAGVFAADTADLFLKTTVNSINEMKITSSEATAAEWTDYAQGTDISRFTSFASDAENAVVINPFVTDPQIVGKIWTRSNNRVGYTVEVSASELVSDDTSNTETIGYTVTGGLNDVDTGDTAVVFISQAAIAGLHEASATISVTLAEAVNALSAGTYTGNITFEYKSN